MAARTIIWHRAFLIPIFPPLHLFLASRSLVYKFLAFISFSSHQTLQSISTYVDQLKSSPDYVNGFNCTLYFNLDPSVRSLRSNGGLVLAAPQSLLFISSPENSEQQKGESNTPSLCSDRYHQYHQRYWMPCLPCRFWWLWKILQY